MPQNASKLRSIWGGSLGNLIEWYDWYVYSAFSLYFAKAFFPAGDLTSQLLSSSAVFAVGFLMRPLGGLLMGWYADRHGRRAALTASVALMCAGSLVIAVCPTHASIGWAAPAILVLARCVQGLSVGGEYGTSATYLSELADPKRRGFISSFQYVTLILGQLAALGVLVLLQRVFLTADELERWGWRIPFALGALGAVAVFRIRRQLVETSAPSAARVSGNPLRALARHPRAVATVIALTLGGTVAFYTYTTYMQKFLVTTVGLSKDTATLLTAAALFIFMCLQPVVGALSDRVGRRPLLIAFGVLGTLGTVPLLTALSGTRSPGVAFALVLAALVIVSFYTSINAIVKAELFPANVRALGVGFPYAVAVSVFGGTAEYLALWAKSGGHESWYYWYVTACIAISLVVYAAMRETRDASELDR